MKKKKREIQAMKKKMLMVDAIILIICLIAFVAFKLSGIIEIIATILVAIICHVFFQNQFAKQEFIENEQKQPSIKEEVYELKNDFPKFEELIQPFAYQIYEFKERQEALKKLIELNSGEKGQYLLDKSKETENFLLQKCKQFRKCLVVLEVLDEEDKQYQENVDVAIRITEITKQMVDGYSDLLSVVNRMGDDLEMNDPGLAKAVDKLKNMKKSAEEPEKSGLFVVTKSDY